MFCYWRTFLFSFPVTYLLFSLTFFCFSHGDSQFPSLQTWASSEMGIEEKYGGEMPRGNSTSFAEQNSNADADQKTLVLVPERTKRKDPLNNFKQYTGGWNISNKHYWASVGFTAYPMFLTAGLWYVGFGVVLVTICICYCCCPRPRHGYSRGCYAISLVFIVILSIAAMLGGAALYTSLYKFNRTIGKTLTYVVYQADNTTEILRNLSNYFDAAKHINVENKFLPPGVQNAVTDLQTKINDTANKLATKTSDNSDGIRNVVNVVRLTVIIVTAAMLVLSLLGLFVSIFGVQCLVFTFVILGWILVAGTFILSGIFVLFHNVAGDSCLAMDQWVQNPTGHTALDDILPCVDVETAQDSLSKGKELTYVVLTLVNEGVNESNADPGRGPLVPPLCNPFLASVGLACPPGAVDIMNATQVWKTYVCEYSREDKCVSKGRLTPTSYTSMTIVVNVSYGFYHYSPFLADLADCDFVRQAFVTVSKDHCPGLRSQSKWMYIALTVVSAAVMMSLILWIVHGREQKHRYYTKLEQAKTS